MAAARLLLNLIWLIFGGHPMALGYAIVALIMFVLITIPFRRERIPTRHAASLAFCR